MLLPTIHAVPGEALGPFLQPDEVIGVHVAGARERLSAPLGPHRFFHHFAQVAQLRLVQHLIAVEIQGAKLPRDHHGVRLVLSRISTEQHKGEFLSDALPTGLHSPAEFGVKTVDEIVVENGLVGPFAYPVLVLPAGGTPSRLLLLPAATRPSRTAGGVGQGQAFGGHAPAGSDVGVALGRLVGAVRSALGLKTVNKIPMELTLTHISSINS